jgi:hypothetical protein
MLSAGQFEEFSNAVCLCVTALFLLGAFLVTCGREINAAIRVTIRRATPQTADHVFEGVLRENSAAAIVTAKMIRLLTNLLPAFARADEVRA